MPPTEAAQPRHGVIVTGINAAVYLCATLALSTATLLVPPLLLLSVVLVAVGGSGMLVVPHALNGLRAWAELERQRVGRFLGQEIPAPARREPPEGIVARFRAAVTDPRARLDTAWALLHGIVGLPLGVIGLSALVGIPSAVIQTPLWWVAPSNDPVNVMGFNVDSWASAIATGTGQVVVCGALLVWASPFLANAHARMAKRLLSPTSSEALEKRVETLTETRAGAVNAHAAELRRIERDLHDGTQARLVALAMRLGLAQRTLGQDPDAAARLLEQAQAGTEEAMAELRGVVRTIYPPVLADRGLPGALSALAADCAFPVRVSVEGADGLPAAVEATAYFVVAESLTNIAKHAHASKAEVAAVREGDVLVVRVTDDGRGGADENGGSGLDGMRRRVDALDGSFTATSPVGGPTAVEVRLPCGR